MDITSVIGIIASIILVLGALIPESKESDSKKSRKNQLLAGGCVLLLAYAVLNYLAGGPIFFVYLQLITLAASFLMFFSTNDRLNAIVLTILCLLATVLSVLQGQDQSVILFIIGLWCIGLGYATKPYSLVRDAGLTIGGFIISIFSYLAGNWIFCILNLFFGLFSGYYLIKNHILKK